MKVVVIFILVVCMVFVKVRGHGRLLKPPSRSSIWRIPQFRHFNPPKNYNDNELYCGSRHQITNPGTDCGVCGDPINEPTPRRNEIGGEFYAGIITGRFRSGQVIEVEVDITAAHLGFMEWRLCTNPETETQECFNRYLLQRTDGQGSRVGVTSTGIYKALLMLPDGVTCDNCILQWNYRAGNNWGQCEDGSGKIGCGPQETFRGCADVSIQ